MDILNFARRDLFLRTARRQSAIDRRDFLLELPPLGARYLTACTKNEMMTATE